MAQCSRNPEKQDADATPRSGARYWAKNGFKVIPLPPGEKGPPLFKGWQNREKLDENGINSYWPPDAETPNNVAIQTGDGIVVLDFDTRHGGDKSLAALEALLPDAPQKVQTPNGWHLYFRHPLPVRNGADVLRTHGLPGVDIRGENGYVVAAGSRVGGKRYALDRQVQIPALPSFLESMLAGRAPTQPAPQTPVVDLDSEASLSLARNWLSGPKGLSGESCDGRTFAAAAMLKDFGVSEGKAVEMLFEHETACGAIADPEGMERAIRNAYSYAVERRPGERLSDLPEYEFDPLPEEDIRRIAASGSPPQDPTPRKTKSHAPVEWGDYRDGTPEREWIWQDMLPRGHVTVLYGDGGTGKSLLAQQLATVAAADSLEDRLLFRQSVTPGPVLALFSEDDADELARRQERINRSLGITVDDLAKFKAIPGVGEDNLLMRFGRDGAGTLTPLLEHLDKTCSAIGPALVVIDNIADTFGGNEIDRGHVNRFLKFGLGSLATRHKCSVLLLGHPSVHGISSGSGLSGSTAWNNAVRSRLYLRRQDPKEPGYDKDGRVLETPKANYRRAGNQLRIRWQDGVWVLPGAAETAAEARARDDLIMEVMRDMIKRGYTLSPNSRANNSAALLITQDDRLHGSLARFDAERALTSLVMSGRLVLGAYTDNHRRQKQRYVVPGN